MYLVIPYAVWNLNVHLWFIRSGLCLPSCNFCYHNTLVLLHDQLLTKQKLLQNYLVPMFPFESKGRMRYDVFINFGLILLLMHFLNSLSCNMCRRAKSCYHKTGISSIVQIINPRKVWEILLQKALLAQGADVIKCEKWTHGIVWIYFYSQMIVSKAFALFTCYIFLNVLWLFPLES